jgi:hypothetical protein
MKQAFLQQLKIVYFMIFLTLISSCVSTSGNFAKFEHSDQVKQTFESYTVSPEYNYYYWGPKSNPKAVVGISNAFSLQSDLWNPIELTPERLRNWIWVQAKRLPATNFQRYGSNITGPHGEHFGVWYSLQDWQQWARIELIENNTIKIGSPINSAGYDRRQEGR